MFDFIKIILKEWYVFYKNKNQTIKRNSDEWKYKINDKINNNRLAFLETRVVFVDYIKIFVKINLYLIVYKLKYNLKRYI